MVDLHKCCRVHKKTYQSNAECKNDHVIGVLIFILLTDYPICSKNLSENDQRNHSELNCFPNTSGKFVLSPVNFLVDLDAHIKELPAEFPDCDVQQRVK